MRRVTTIGALAAVIVLSVVIEADAQFPFGNRRERSNSPWRGNSNSYRNSTADRIGRLLRSLRSQRPPQRNRNFQVQRSGASTYVSPPLSMDQSRRFVGEIELRLSSENLQFLSSSSLLPTWNLREGYSSEELAEYYKKKLPKPRKPTGDIEKDREYIENVAKITLESRGRKMEVTSRSEGREGSAPHMRGAVDIRSKDLSSKARHAEAQEISKNLGAGHVVIVEEVDFKSGKQTNTSYRDGKPHKTHKNQPITATNTHTHIQPDAVSSSTKSKSK